MSRDTGSRQYGSDDGKGEHYLIMMIVIELRYDTIR